MTDTLPRPIRVMIVDDSAVIRSIIEKALKSSADFQVVGFAAHGEAALSTLDVCNPDILTLDIEMPGMDGITALPLLLKKKPGLKVLMCSTLSERGAAVSIKALALGAADCVLKPSGAGLQSTEFQDTLVRLARQIGLAALTPKPSAASLKMQAGRGGFAPKILAIGSSTGGPNALEKVLGGLRGLPLPIVITQHMPKTFTRIFAQHLSTATGVECVEGQDGMLLKPGCAYLAPGGFHMVFRKALAGTTITLDDGPLENFVKPAVDPMLRSLHTQFGGSVLTVILTGMGEDGLAGARVLTQAGGQLIAQDAATSIVWGMPGAVANAGICNAVLPLDEIAGAVRKACGVATPLVAGARA